MSTKNSSPKIQIKRQKLPNAMLDGKEFMATRLYGTADNGRVIEVKVLNLPKTDAGFPMYEAKLRDLLECENARFNRVTGRK